METRINPIYAKDLRREAELVQQNRANARTEKYYRKMAYYRKKCEKAASKGRTSIVFRPTKSLFHRISLWRFNSYFQWDQHNCHIAINEKNGKKAKGCVTVSW